MVVRTMEAVTISTSNNGTIEIEQQLDLEEPDRIVLYPEQIPAVIKWPEEAAGELLQERASRSESAER